MFWIELTTSFKLKIGGFIFSRAITTEPLLRSAIATNTSLQRFPISVLPFRWREKIYSTLGR
jgi:hypothetical protein